MRKRKQKKQDEKKFQVRENLTDEEELSLFGFLEEISAFPFVPIAIIYSSASVRGAIPLERAEQGWRIAV